MEEEEIFPSKQLTGCIEIEQVMGKSVATRLFSKYPLKLIIPSKAGPSSADVVWIYALSYGGGFVSGDSINIKVRVASCCKAVLTTQASTKVYKSINGQVCEQMLQVSIGKDGIFVLLPDPVTCFSSAKYKQFQAFNLDVDANIVLVDWCTSGRRERGEVWSFEHYKSTNQIFLMGKGPLFLDSICLENGGMQTLLSRMQPFHVVAMVLLYGPQLRFVCRQLEEVVQLLNCNMRPTPCRGKTSLPDGVKHADFAHPGFLVSCSTFGPQHDGLVVRIVASTTELVYDFLRHHLACLSSLIGVLPYTRK